MSVPEYGRTCSTLYLVLFQEKYFGAVEMKKTRWLFTLAASSGKCEVTVWRPSVCLSRRQTHSDSMGSSM